MQHPWALAIVLVAVTAACATRPPANELTLKVDVIHSLDTSVGRIWKATVRGVIAGELPDRVVTLHTLPPEDPGDHLRCCAMQQGVIVRFARDSREPYHGFQAADGSYWRIVEIVIDRPVPW